MTIDQVLQPLPSEPPAPFRQQADLVEARIVRAIARATSAPIDLRTRRLVAACIEEFVRADCQPHVALRSTGPLMDELGTSGVRNGCTRRELETAFTHVHDIVMGALGHFTGGRLVGEPMLELRRDVKHYLHGLRRQLRVAADRERVQQDHVRAEQAAVLGPAAAGALPQCEGRVRVLISVEAELPDAVLDDPRLLAGRSAFEVLVPETVDPIELESHLTGQVVVGPLTSTDEVGESSALGWRAAALLREGRAADARRLVPCGDLISAILMGNGVMTKLLAEKHLGPLVALTARKRRELSAVLLAWLERGLAGNALAREIGMPPQTVHHRLKQLRELFGETLDEPGQRLELIIALRATHAEWSQLA